MNTVHTRAFNWLMQELQKLKQMKFDELNRLPAQAELNAPAEFSGHRFIREKTESESGGIAVSISHIAPSASFLPIPTISFSAKQSKKMETRFGKSNPQQAVRIIEFRMSKGFEMCPDGTVIEEIFEHDSDD